MPAVRSPEEKWRGWPAINDTNTWRDESRAHPRPSRTHAALGGNRFLSPLEFTPRKPASGTCPGASWPARSAHTSCASASVLPKARFSQRITTVRHPRFGKVKLLMVEGRPTRKGQEYVATVNRVVPRRKKRR